MSKRSQDVIHAMRRPRRIADTNFVAAQPGRIGTKERLAGRREREIVLDRRAVERALIA